MGKNKSKYDFDSGNLLFYIFRKFKILMIVSVIAFIVSAIAAFMIKPKYKSTVIMFPVSSAPISKSLLSYGYSGKSDVMSFGEEEDAEQLLQVLNSEEIKNRIIAKYDLMKHYGIDKNGKFPFTKLYKEFDGNFSFHRTEYMSVIVEVLDINPDTAALMANDVAAFVDTVMQTMQRERARKAYEIVKSEYLALDNSIKVLEDSLNKIRLMGINDYESQSEVLNEYYVKATMEGKIGVANMIQKKLDVISKYGGTYVAIRDFLLSEKQQLTFTKQKFAEAKVELDQDLPHKFVVESAHPAEKKAYPKRMNIVIVATISAFLLTLILLIVLENIKKFLQKEKE
jgi:capsular polysaccharide biosynthesis protein